MSEKRECSDLGREVFYDDLVSGKERCNLQTYTVDGQPVAIGYDSDFVDFMESLEGRGVPDSDVYTDLIDAEECGGVLEISCLVNRYVVTKCKKCGTVYMLRPYVYVVEKVDYPEKKVLSKKDALRLLKEKLSLAGDR
jgi:hypothetical protein